MGIKRWGQVLCCVFLLGLVFLMSPMALRAEVVNPSASEAPAADSVFAASPSYYTGKVTIIFSEGENTDPGFSEKYQRVNVRLNNGPDAGKDEMIEYSTSISAFEQQKLAVGDTVIVAPDTIGGSGYVILDKLRIPGVLVGLAAFFLLAILFGGIRGVTSLFGLAASLGILAYGVIPAIIAGHDALTVSVIGAFSIAVISILLAHGVNKRSGIALGSTLVTLIGAVVFSIIAVTLAKLSGSGTEEAVYLQIGSLPSLNLQGLLLGGMIIGTLGVLDDVTTAQVAAVEEIGIADSSLTRKELYKRGLRVGREHIASLVNTLALAYAGASFPLFLLFAANGGPPLWVVLNAEYVMEEVVRAIVGGASLVIAVPISTFAAAWYYGKKH
ncbi:MAG: YibE/F family protein [Patescibacteria group bacterium]